MTIFPVRLNLIKESLSLTLLLTISMKGAIGEISNLSTYASSGIEIIESIANSPSSTVKIGI